MNSRSIIRLLLAGLSLCLVYLFAPPAQAQTPEPTPTPLSIVPAGFELLDAALGVQLYRKEYPNGNPDFVQVINLALGARLRLLHGAITEARPNKGAYGGPDPRFTSLPIETYWQQVSQEDPLAFCVTNGAFFYMPEYPTRLAFPLKVDGEMISEGWGVNTYVDQKLILELWDDRAAIRPLSAEALHRSQAPNILGGLTEEANKRAKYAVGRTFVGLADYDSDGRLETVLLFNTQTATQANAAAVLRTFGATQVMMLDGGGSTQLLCKSGWHIRSDRPVPQAIAVFASRPPPLAARLVDYHTWAVLVSGEHFPLRIEVQNTGANPWAVETTQLLLDPTPWGTPRWLFFHTPIAPQERAVLEEALFPLHESGLYHLTIPWGLRQGAETWEGEPLQMWAIVLPPHLKETRATLAAEVERWQKEKPAEEVAPLVEQWLQEHTRISLPTVPPRHRVKEERAVAIHPQDALYIPLLMLPIMLLLGHWLNRRAA